MSELSAMWNALAAGLVPLIASHRRSLGMVQTDRKADGTIVSSADLEAQEFITETIREFDPAGHVLAEEDQQDGQTGHAQGRRRVWVVDPIDGTNEFLDPGSTEFCSAVALVEDGYPVAALIVAPELGEDRSPLILAADTRVRSVLANGLEPAAAPLTRLVSASRSSKSRPGWLERKSCELGLAVKVRATSQTLDMVRAVIDLEPLTGLRSFRCFAARQQLLWDAAPGIAVAAARGRVVVDSGGEALCPFEPSLLTLREPRLATVMLIHETDWAWVKPS